MECCRHQSCATGTMTYDRGKQNERLKDVSIECPPSFYVSTITIINGFLILALLCDTFSIDYNVWPILLASNGRRPHVFKMYALLRVNAKNIKLQYTYYKDTSHLCRKWLSTLKGTIRGAH